MQFCDFAEAEKPGGVERELHRLAERGILSEKQAGAVRIPRIEAFFASDLYRNLMKNAEVRREFKFSVLVPAARYFPAAESEPDENVLLQGVIDCLVQPQLLERVHALCDSAEDVSHRLYAEFEELYIKNLGF